MRHLACLALVVALATVAAAQDVDPPPPPGPDTPITAMVAIPAGEYTMGRPGSEEMPRHRVRVDAFLLDEHEVTNAQYQAFCEATGARLPIFWGMEEFRCGEQWPDHPVVGVNRSSAEQYAAWVGKRLPTEAEWEYAARSGTGLTYGIADTISTEFANYKKSEHGATVPVKSYQPNAYGLYDLIGNVREWVADYYGVLIPEGAIVPDDGEGSLDGVVPRDNPIHDQKHRLGLVKGGGWFSGGGCNSAYRRNGYPAGWGDFAVGFRCARDAE